MKRHGLHGAVLGAVAMVACEVHIGGPPPAPPPPPAQAAVAARPAAPQPGHPTPPPAPLPVAHLLPGRTVNPPPAPRPAPPDTSVMARVRAKMTKKCGPIEATGGDWVDIDCGYYGPTTQAKVLRQLPKLALLRRGALRLDVAIPAHTSASQLPATIDHRAQGIEGPIKDQGSLPASTAFSLSSAMDNAVRRLNRPDTISPMHLWVHYGQPNMGLAADRNVRRPVATLNAWPYNAAQACKAYVGPGYYGCADAYRVRAGSANTDPEIQAKLKQEDLHGEYRLAAVTAIPRDPDTLVGVLATGADVWVGLGVEADAWKGSALSADHVVRDWNGNDGQLAVVLAGYRQAAGGRQFLVHNSWGDRWGDHGYAWISERSLRAHLTEAYTVKVEPERQFAKLRVSRTPTGRLSVVPLKPGHPAHTGALKTAWGDNNTVTDDDCSETELVDSVTGQCAQMCWDQSRPANGQCPSNPQPPPPPPQPCAPTVFKHVDVTFTSAPYKGSETKVEQDRSAVGFAPDGSERVTWGWDSSTPTATLTTPAHKSGIPISTNGLKSVRFAATLDHVAVLPDGQPLQVVSTADGHAEWTRDNGTGCAAAFLHPNVLLFHESADETGQPGSLWRVDLGSKQLTSLTSKVWPAHCWPSADATTWIVHDDQSGGIAWALQGGDNGWAAPSLIATPVHDPVIGSPAGDRVCYFRETDQGNCPVVCTRVADHCDEVLSDNGLGWTPMKFDDTGARLLFATSESPSGGDDWGQFEDIADFASQTVWRLHGVQGSTADILSGGNAVVTTDGSTLTVCDVNSKQQTTFPDQTHCINVTPKPGHPREFWVGQETDDGRWDQYNATY